MSGCTLRRIFRRIFRRNPAETKLHWGKYTYVHAHKETCGGQKRDNFEQLRAWKGSGKYRGLFPRQTAWINNNAPARRDDALHRPLYTTTVSCGGRENINISIKSSLKRSVAPFRSHVNTSSTSIPVLLPQPVSATMPICCTWCSRFHVNFHFHRDSLMNAEFIFFTIYIYQVPVIFKNF